MIWQCKLLPFVALLLGLLGLTTATECPSSCAAGCFTDTNVCADPAQGYPRCHSGWGKHCGPCEDGYWGQFCELSCGACKHGPCNKASGECPASKEKGVDSDDRCQDGYANDYEYKCDKAMCFGKNGCDHDGKCVAPNVCVCSGGGAMGQTVGVVGTYSDHNGNDVEGTNCVSLRQSGIIGALYATIVLIISISACGIAAEKKLFFQDSR